MPFKSCNPLTVDTSHIRSSLYSLTLHSLLWCTSVITQRARLLPSQPALAHIRDYTMCAAHPFTAFHWQRRGVWWLWRPYALVRGLDLCCDSWVHPLVATLLVASSPLRPGGQQSYSGALLLGEATAGQLSYVIFLCAYEVCQRPLVLTGCSNPICFTNITHNSRLHRFYIHVTFDP